jgi:hypothetical protein
MPYAKIAPMSDPAAPNLTKIADRLSDSLYLHIVDTLRNHLPEPPCNDPDHLAHQLDSAIAEVGSFAPVNAAEARLAARYVAFSAYAEHCLHLARLKESNGQLEWVLKCLAQANATARQANGQLSLLLRLQRERRKLETDGHALNRAAWAEHIAIRRMTDALAGQPTSEPIAEPPPPPPAPEPIARANASPSPCGIEPRSGSMVGGGGRRPTPPHDQTLSHHPLPPAEPPSPELAPEPPPLNQAQHYAVLYPERAALIRRAGRVPDNITFDPPDDDLVQALLTTEDSVFTMLDRCFAHYEG